MYKEPFQKELVEQKINKIQNLKNILLQNNLMNT